MKLQNLLITFIVSILISGCGHYLFEGYFPVDYNEIAYIPKHRPIRFYRYEDWWYAEPHIFLIFEDSSGYRERIKVPRSKIQYRLEKERPLLKQKKDVESIMRDIKKRSTRDRRINRLRIRKRS